MFRRVLVHDHRRSAGGGGGGVGLLVLVGGLWVGNEHGGCAADRQLTEAAGPGPADRQIGM